MTRKESGQPIPEEGGPRKEIPSAQEVLDQKEIFGQIREAVEQTKETGGEHCFQASISKQGEITVNQLLKGGEEIGLYEPIIGGEHDHPQGQGFHLPPDHDPFFIFHSHPESPHPSLKDILACFSWAEQNYNLSSGSDPYWINPLAVIVNTDREAAFYQFNPEVIDRLLEEELLSKIGQACVEMAEELGVEEYGGLKIEEMEHPKVILISEHQGRPVLSWPKFITDHPERIQEIGEKIGLKTVKRDDSSRETILEASQEFEIFVPWED